MCNKFQSLLNIHDKFNCEKTINWAGDDHAALGHIKFERDNMYTRDSHNENHNQDLGICQR